MRLLSPRTLLDGEGQPVQQRGGKSCFGRCSSSSSHIPPRSCACVCRDGDETVWAQGSSRARSQLEGGDTRGAHGERAGEHAFPADLSWRPARWFSLIRVGMMVQRVQRAPANPRRSAGTAPPIPSRPQNPCPTTCLQAPGPHAASGSSPQSPPARTATRPPSSGWL